MAAYTWTTDVASGVYKNHIISKKLRRAAIVDTVFQQYVKVESGFGKHKGETMNLRRIKNLAIPTNARLSEQTRIPIDTFQTATNAITIAEWGRGVEYTNFAKDLESFDLDGEIGTALKRQLKVVTDNAAAAAFTAATNFVIAIPTGLSAVTWDTDGTPSTAATVNANVQLLGIIRDQMRDTYQIPFYEKNFYAGIASTKFLRGIKSDPDFQFWRQYLQPGDVLMNSEVGSVEQIRFAESNNTAALSNAKGTGSVLGEAVIFGEDAVVMVEVEPFELRAAIPGDFGRFKAVAWVGVGEWGSPWANTAVAGEIRIVRVTSS